MGLSAELESKPYGIKESKFWKVTIGLTLASCFNFANLYIVQPLLLEYVREFQVSPTLASLSLSLTTISLVIGLLVFGFFSDRIGRLPILHWTLCLSVIPLLVIPLFDSYWWFLIWRFITGFLLAGLPAVGVAYISEEIGIKHRGFAVSLFIASNALGGMAGRVIGGYFADVFSWQTAFYALAIGGIVISGLCILLIPRSRFFQRHDRSLIEDLKGMSVHLKNPLLIVSFIYGVMLQVNFSGIWNYIPFYLEGAPFFLSIKWISLTYFTYLFGIVGSPFFGHLASKFGVIRMLFIGLTVMIIGNLTTLSTNIVIVIVGLSLVCLGFFSTHSMTSTWVGINAKHHKSGATSLYLVSYYTGVTLGGPINGGIWSSYHWTGVVAFCTVLASIAGIIFYSVVKGKEQNILKERVV